MCSSSIFPLRELFSFSLRCSTWQHDHDDGDLDVGDGDDNLQHLPSLDLVPLQVGDGLLGQLEVALNLSLQLLHVALVFLLALPGVLDLVKTLLQPDLELVQVVALVLERLDLLVLLHLALRDRLLLLVPEHGQVTNRL